MREEMRLHLSGVPLVDALTLCNSMRKEGSLKEFVDRVEAAYRERFARELSGNAESDTDHDALA